ncbi:MULTISPECIES: type II CAAX prenyl endopeptidase Rce1 family protein [Thermoanaerobacterium]|uniref:Abortive infection protein n=2 Tax=Thermoanaerobacterium TaxID=28895 RepID=W9EDU4_9THEO|nr:MULTISPECIES: CPBP family glutamic-type intramembrane protease [Thermoanaerobacterium]AFK85682.1 hypothetical protein Tsac_0658 [Thermoanaerobacterium saccharolyticum JW/SL-YS485]ETO37904.1 hypothetical protein V518_1977 [Thermoanaerobacterium aotearoense SCUT27]
MKKLNKLNDLEYIVIMAFLSYLMVTVIFKNKIIIQNIANLTSKDGFINIAKVLGKLLILYPIINTYLYQRIVIYILKKFNIKSDLLLMLFSSLLFAITYYDSFIPMFLFGIILSYSYILYNNKKITSQSITLLIYMLTNFLSIVTIFVEKLNLLIK